MKFSVIMSVYNGEHYLRESILSILNQEVKDFEFIIIDDNSSDSSPEIILDYSKKDNRIKFLKNKKNLGLTKSLNICIKQALGDYIVRQDADDISLPNRLEDFQEHELKNKIDFYSTSVIEGESLNKAKKISPNIFLRNKVYIEKFKQFNFLTHGALIIRREILDKLAYNDSYRYSQDYELYLNLINNGYKLCFNNKASYFLRTHKNQVSLINKKEQENSFISIRKKYNLKIYNYTFFTKIYFYLIDIYKYIFK